MRKLSFILCRSDMVDASKLQWLMQLQWKARLTREKLESQRWPFQDTNPSSGIVVKLRFAPIVIQLWSLPRKSDEWRWQEKGNRNICMVYLLIGCGNEDDNLKKKKIISISLGPRFRDPKYCYQYFKKDAIKSLGKNQLFCVYHTIWKKNKEETSWISF